MYTVESKSMLAKLMATENIKVEHRSGVRTAKFNLATRTLTCPIWKDMSGDLYDLLMGHEISHALRTPLEGWHDSVIYAGGNAKASPKEQKAFRHFLNVVEDARIEKLVKRQYPGLRGPMYKGYRDLMVRDFFKLSTVQDLNKLYLIDKLNLSAKVGSLLNITFTPAEQPYYDEMQNLETFEEVLVLARKLYAYSKVEQKKDQQDKKDKKEEKKDKKDKQKEQGQDGEEFEDGEESGGGEDESDEGDESTSGESDEEEGDADSDEGEAEEGSESDANESEEDDKGDGGKGQDEGDPDDEDNSEDESGEPGGKGTDGEEADPSDDFIPKSKTDEAFRQREDALIDTGNIRSVYITIPTPNLKDVITPVSVVNRGLSNHFISKNDRILGQSLLTDFKAKNEDYISLLAKEFEMKKAARSFSQAKKSESGDINISKLASYRTEDNIFKKLLIVNKGKSHGLALLLDRSSSMRDSTEAATEQILIMALFCRKVNIPFVAYTFVDNCKRSNLHDFGPRQLNPFSTNPNEFITNNLAFREILNSSMQASEFNNAMSNQLQLAKALHRDNRTFGRSGIPDHEDMGSTPLNEAIIVLRDVLRIFKRKHQLDIVNAIIVHDGDSDRNYMYHGAKYPYTTDKAGNRSYVPEDHRFDTQYDRVTIRDAKENVSFDCPVNNRGLQTALLSWLQATTGCGVFGFYITGKSDDSSSALQKMYVNKLGVPLGIIGRYDSEVSEKSLLLAQLQLKLSEEKFLESYSTGYSRFYFIPGDKALAADNGELLNTASSGKWTPNRLLAAFKKVSKKRVVSRVLVTRFIELIATR